MNNPVPVKKPLTPPQTVPQAKIEPVLKPIPQPEQPKSAERPIPAGLQAPIPGAVKHCSPNSISPAGYLWNTWNVVAARGVVLADIKLPEYWLHIADKLRPNDKIEILAEDGTWEATLRVINADRTWAKVYVLTFDDKVGANDGMPPRAEDEYDIEWTTSGMFTITKKTQKGQPPLKDGFRSKLEAMQWLDGHLKAIS